MTESNACFERLGIKPTDDKRQIKRAYAVLLKTIDLANEQARFAQLRTDYEAALGRAEVIGGMATATATATAIASEPDRSDGNVPRSGAASGAVEHRATASASAALTAPRGLPMAMTARRADEGPPAGLDDSDSAEREAIGRLVDPGTPDRDRVLEDGLRRFGWEMVGSGDADLANFGSARSWFVRLLAERTRWKNLEVDQRVRCEALLARVAMQAPSGAIDAVQTWEALAPTVDGFPLWTALTGGAAQLDHWKAACAAVPQWKRKLWRYRKKLVVGFIMLAVLTGILAAISWVLSDDDTPDWATSFAQGVASLMPLVIVVLIAGSLAPGIKRRFKRLKAAWPATQQRTPVPSNIKILAMSWIGASVLGMLIVPLVLVVQLRFDGDVFFFLRGLLEVVQPYLGVVIVSVALLAACVRAIIRRRRR